MLRGISFYSIRSLSARLEQPAAGNGVYVLLTALSCNVGIVACFFCRIISDRFFFLQSAHSDQLPMRNVSLQEAASIGKNIGFIASDLVSSCYP